MPIETILPVAKLASDLQILGYSNSLDNQLERIRDLEDAKLRSDLGLENVDGLTTDQQLVYTNAIVELVEAYLFVRDPAMAAKRRESIIDNAYDYLGTEDVEIVSGL